jgi:hypothetical protein
MVLTNTNEQSERVDFVPTISVCSFGGTLISHMSAADVILALGKFQVTPSDSIRAQRAQLLEELMGAQAGAPIVDGIMAFEGELASAVSNRLDDRVARDEFEVVLAARQSLEEELARTSAALGESLPSGSKKRKNKATRVKKKAKESEVESSGSDSSSDSMVIMDSKKSRFKPQSIIPILNTESDDLDVNVNRVGDWFFVEEFLV